MSEQHLLRIILRHSQKGGIADGNAVKKEYGAGFDDTFISLVRKGYIESRGPVGSIMLSATGRYEAER